MSKVTEFLDIFKQVCDGLAERQLEAFALPDVVWKIANYIDSDGYKKNGYNQPPTPMQQAGAEKKVSGLLEERKVEAKQSAEGKAYKVYSFKVDGQWYNTFDAKAFGGVKFTEGDEVELSLKAGKNPKYFNIVAAKKLGEAAAEEDIPW
jgi:hypothetical protein